MQETFWIGSFDLAGYELQVLSKTRNGAAAALKREYDAWVERTAKSSGFRPQAFKTFAEMDEYFGVRLEEVELDKVVWP